MARKRKLDPKAAALVETRTLNPRPEAVRDEQFGSSEFFDARDVVQVKYEMVRRVRVDGAPVTAAAAAFGFSRPSFYEAAAAVDREGLGGLVPAKPGPRGAHKLTDEVIAYAQQLREQDPGGGVGAAGGGDRGQVRDQGAPAVGGAGPGPRRKSQKWRRAMKSPRISARARSTATNSCGSGRCPATSTGGDWAWVCCSTAESPLGWACAPRWPRSGQRPPDRCRPRPPVVSPRSWSGCWRRWRWPSRRGGERV